jgi:pyrroline-5-carboxylate reductase
LLPQLREDAILISIVAGYPIDRLQELSGHKYVARVMPNTPAFVGAGMTVWTPSKEMDEHQCDYLRHLLASFGSEIRADEEAYMVRKGASRPTLGGGTALVDED